MADLVHHPLDGEVVGGQRDRDGTPRRVRRRVRERREAARRRLACELCGVANDGSHALAAQTDAADRLDEPVVRAERPTRSALAVHERSTSRRSADFADAGLSLGRRCECIPHPASEVKTKRVVKDDERSDERNGRHETPGNPGRRDAKQAGAMSARRRRRGVTHPTR